MRAQCLGVGDVVRVGLTVQADAEAVGGGRGFQRVEVVGWRAGGQRVPRRG